MASNRVTFHPSTTYSQRLFRKTRGRSHSDAHDEAKEHESSIRGSRGQGMYDLFETNIMTADIDLV